MAQGAAGGIGRLMHVAVSFAFLVTVSFHGQEGGGGAV